MTRTTDTDKILTENLLRKTQAAMIISRALSYEPSLGESPEQMIENAIDGSAAELQDEQRQIIDAMLRLAESADIHIKKQRGFYPVGGSRDDESDEDSDDASDSMSDEEINQLINNLSDEDLLYAYDDDEFGVYNAETGEQIDEELDEQFYEPLNEVLSRMERIKARLRMAKNKTKLQTKLKIALHKRSSPETLQRRARRLAVKTLTQKIAKKPLSDLSTSEKERIERIVARRKTALSRIATKLVPHVRQIEKTRLQR